MSTADRHHRQALPGPRPGPRASGVAGAPGRRARRPGARPVAGVSIEAPRFATDDEIEAVHPAATGGARALAGRRAQLDPDTVMSPGSWDAARLAAGAAVEAALATMSGRARNAFALVRPPGHHAEPDRAMGFCLLNNAAIAAEAARRAGAARVLIVDWDVHHGNGTQDIFAARDDVLYMSVHQFPVLSGHRRGRRGRRRRRPRRDGQVPAARRPGRRGLRRRVPRSVPARGARVQARAGDRLGRLRRARARSARGHARERARVRGDGERAGPARRRDLRRQDRADAGRRLRPAGADGVGARDAGGDDGTARGVPAGRETTTLDALENAREALGAAGRAVPKS